MRRALSVLALVALDVAGLALGVYIALVLRSVVYGDTIYWSLLWKTGPADWLPFLAPITVLVSFRAASTPRASGVPGRADPRRADPRALIVPAFGLGTDHEFTTTGLIPTAVATSALAIGALRAAYGSIALELMRVAGVRAGSCSRRRAGQPPAPRAAAARATGRARDRHRRHASGPASSPPLDRLAAMLERDRPDEVVLTEADFDEQTVLDVVQLAHRHAVKVKLAPATTDLLLHEGQYVPGQGVPLFELRPPVLSGFAWLSKRAFDLVVAALLAVVGIPLWLLVAAAIKLESRGPVFYVDRRIGVGEREFGMLKFRTMVADAADRQVSWRRRTRRGRLFKIRDDPRVTRVGRTLRRLSFDELPQLLNVLRGEMSLVGPRPLPAPRPRDALRLAQARYHVLPGMTGLWQISGRSGLEFDDLVRLDFTYIENWSIWSDVTIIARTIPAVLSGRGAY